MKPSDFAVNVVDRICPTALKEKPGFLNVAGKFVDDELFQLRHRVENLLEILPGKFPDGSTGDRIVKDLEDWLKHYTPNE